MVYIAKNQVRMHDTDMAGRLYFPRQYRFVNDALEDLFEAEGLSFLEVFNEDKVLTVIVHSEADYFARIKVYDKLAVHVSCERIGTTSFTLLYKIFRTNRDPHDLVGTAKTVHVSINRELQQKINIPEKLIAILKKYKEPV